jgi:hypothetical protein
LNAGGDVGGFPQGQACLPGTAAQLAYDHQAGVDPNADSQSEALILHETGV